MSASSLLGTPATFNWVPVVLASASGHVVAPGRGSPSNSSRAASRSAAVFWMWARLTSVMRPVCRSVDLNADHVALTLADATGNPLTTLRDAPAIR
jgi:hypothetical protein